MSRLLTLIIFTLSLQTAFAQSEDCDVSLINVSKESLKDLKMPYFKRYSYYTQESKNDPSADTLFLMVLNFHLQNHLTWNQYLVLQKRLDKVPGENSYSSPTLDILLPHMLSYLKETGYKGTVSEEVIKLAKEDYRRLGDKIFPEIIGGNRVVYRILESEKQTVVRNEGNGSYIVSTTDCPGKLYLFDLSDYEKYESFEDEIILLGQRLEANKTKEILEYIKGSLSPEAFFYRRLKAFLTPST